MLLFWWGFVGSVLVWAAESPRPLSLQSVLPKNIFQRVLKEREVAVHAKLEPQAQPPLKTYSFFSAMVVRASLAETRRVLTDYELYAEMIPYIDRAQYNASNHILRVEGGIFKFKLSSDVKFEEKSDRWIRFEVVRGHFTGLTGEFFFETLGEQGTGVYFSGSQSGERWPPAFILERGAEIVFEFTAKRMRSFIESQRVREVRKELEQGAANGSNEIPRPRTHL